MRDVLSWSLPIGQMFGIMVRVHFTMPIMMIGLIGREYLRTDSVPNAWHDAAMVMGLMFLSVLLHEFGHCFAARFMDGEADEVLLWPIGGLATCKSLPFTWRAHFVFTLGGPLVNLVLCVICALLLAFALDQPYSAPFNPIWYPYRENAAGAMMLPVWGSPDVLSSNLLAIILVRFFWVNWVQFLFNMLMMGIPFDGGRLLQAGLWPRLGYYQATYVAIYAGFLVMAIIGICSIWFREPLLAYLTIFVYVACAQEMAQLEAPKEDSLFGYDFSGGYTSLEKDEETPPLPPKEKKQNFIQRWLAQRAAKKEQQEKEQREADDKRMDELLDKIQKFGKESLTAEEERFLKRVSDRFKNKP